MALKYGLAAWQQYHPRDDAGAPVVLCFGDSWFWYPIPGVGNLCDRFLDFGRGQSLDICAIGVNGMEIALPGKAMLNDLTTFLQWEAETVGMIVVSGGGNDFAGPEDLDPLLRKGSGSSAGSWLRKKAVDKLFSDVRKGYQRIVYLRDIFCPGVPIVTHCYDYAHATGKGLLWLSPWLKPSFDALKVPQGLRCEIVRIFIDGLAAVQLGLAGTRYHFVDTRGLLSAGDWANELHPTREGFNKIARPFYAAFEKIFPDRVGKPTWF